MQDVDDWPAPGLDVTDFIDGGDVVSRLRVKDTLELRSVLKANPPELTLSLGSDQLADPHNPPGRLMLLRKEALALTGIAANGQLYGRTKAAGRQAAITGSIVHRHLSLLNFFDYTEYEMDARDDFIIATRQEE